MVDSMGELWVLSMAESTVSQRVVKLVEWLDAPLVDLLAVQMVVN